LTLTLTIYCTSSSLCQNFNSSHYHPHPYIITLVLIIYIKYIPKILEILTVYISYSNFASLSTVLLSSTFSIDCILFAFSIDIPLSICILPTPLYHLQGPHSKADDFHIQSPMTFQKSTHCKGTSVHSLTSPVSHYVYRYSPRSLYISDHIYCHESDVPPFLFSYFHNQ
jgi:hypothetical protein